MESKVTNLANLMQSCIDKKAHLAGKILHGNIFRAGLFSNTFLYNRLIEFYSKCNNISYAHRTFEKISRKDVYSWNAILSACCKAGRLQNAHNLFGKMPERNTVSWNTFISALVQNGYEQNALDFYNSMISEGIVPTRFTLASIFSACGTLVDTNHGRRSHGLAIKIGLDENVYVVNALLCTYAKCGLLRDAIQIFEGMIEPNEVTFTALMSSLAEMHQVMEAMEMFKLMYRKGIRIDSVSLSSLFGICAREEGRGEFGFFCYVNGQIAHGISTKLGFEKDLYLSNSMLDMYAKNRDVGSAEKVFMNMSETSLVSWNVMISSYGQENQTAKALECFRKMQTFGFEPDEVTYINMLAACGKSGDVITAREMFENMSNPSVGSWNSLLSGYYQTECHEEAIKLFREMQFKYVRFDRTTLAIVLGSFAAGVLIQGGKQVHAASLKADLDIDLYVASGLISMYSKSGFTNVSEHIFDKISEPDIICWNSMISGFSINSLNEKAFDFFRKMQESGKKATEYSYASILTCCGKLSSSLIGQQVHAHIEKNSFVNDIFVRSSLLGMYCRSGEIDEARKFFNLMLHKNTITWNEMIHGYAQNGRGKEAVDLYNDMIKQGDMPDIITFVAILTGCSHSGLVDIGIQIFNSMEQEHGVEPVLDHYTCIVDALGRAGRFDELEAFLDKMPFQDDPIIWEVLLSSCRVYGDVKLGKRAAEELAQLDPGNSIPYVLLGNIYSSLGRWDEARDVRERMITKKVVKDPGVSWI